MVQDLNMNQYSFFKNKTRNDVMKLNDIEFHLHKEQVKKPAFYYKGVSFVFETEEERQQFVSTTSTEDLDHIIDTDSPKGLPKKAKSSK